MLPLKLELLLMYELLVVGVLVSIAFVTLLERKVLGYMQIRKGPNKVGIGGILQPFSDAVKLFFKGSVDLLMLNLFGYFMSPLLGLLLMSMFWLIYFYLEEGLIIYDVVYFMCVSGLGVYVVLFSGWASNSKYSLIGSYRGVAQTISYEVSFSFMLLSVVMIGGLFSFMGIILGQESLMNLSGFFVLFMLWMITILAETNRMPFDFSESESELVSGFNVEYGGGLFAVLFMTEYGNIIFMSVVSSLIFFGGIGLLGENFIIIIIFILLVRGTLVRFRYDNLMMMAWKIILPFSLYWFFLVGVMSGFMLW